MIKRGRARSGRVGLILLVVFATLAVTTLPQPAAASTGSNLNRALNRIMDLPNRPPGISMQIVKNGRSQYYRRGVSNVKTKQKPRIHQRFRIASVAKAFSGAVALNLVARGRLRMRSTIGEVLPGLMPRASQVTLGQALHHTGGLPEYIKSKGFLKSVGGNPGAYVAPRRIIRWVRNSPLTHRPGSKYEYSDTDNIVVGLMAEKVTGIPYIRQIRRVLGPRIGGLKATFMPRTVKMPGPYIHGYDIEPGKKPDDISSLINPSGAWASGGIVSTLPNLSRFFRAYVSGRFFGQGKARSIKRAQRSWLKGDSQPAGPGNNWAGMGLFRYVTKCGVMYGHTGSFPGYRVFAASSADGSRSVAFVANAQILPSSDLPNAGQISARIRRAQVAAVCHALR